MIQLTPPQTGQSQRNDETTPTVMALRFIPAAAVCCLS